MENPKGGQSDVFITKDPLTRGVECNHWQGVKTGLSLFHGNRSFFTDLDTAFAAKAFIRIHGYGFVVFHFKNFNRANVYAFFAACAFFFVYDNIKSHYKSLLSN
jgi:hypothetical protein